MGLTVKIRCISVICEPIFSVLSPGNQRFPKSVPTSAASPGFQESQAAPTGKTAHSPEHSGQSKNIRLKIRLKNPVNPVANANMEAEARA
jgi:hypothetical protein